MLRLLVNGRSSDVNYHVVMDDLTILAGVINCAKVRIPKLR